MCKNGEVLFTTPQTPYGEFQKGSFLLKSSGRNIIKILMGLHT